MRTPVTEGNTAADRSATSQGEIDRLFLSCRNLESPNVSRRETIGADTKVDFGGWNGTPPFTIRDGTIEACLRDHGAHRAGIVCLHRGLQFRGWRLSLLHRESPADRCRRPDECRPRLAIVAAGDDERRRPAALSLDEDFPRD